MAVAVPLDGEQFMLQLNGDGNHEFARHFRSLNEVAGLSDEYYKRTYTSMARELERTCNSVTKLGVAVHRAVSIEDLPAIFKGKTVVTIFGHWRFAELDDDDVIDPAKFIHLLREPTDGVHELVRDEVRRRDPGLLDATATIDDRELRGRLARIIRDITRDVHAAYSSAAEREAFAGRDVFAIPLLAALLLHRVTFETAFDGAIRPARALELADGFCSLSKFIGAIPGGFDGILDLTICNSMVIAAVIKQQRPECLVAVSRQPVHLHVRMALYGLAIYDLARRSNPYMDVIERVSTVTSNLHGGAR